MFKFAKGNEKDGVGTLWAQIQQRHRIMYCPYGKSGSLIFWRCKTMEKNMIFANYSFTILRLVF
jgi:hypothetical protein